MSNRYKSEELALLNHEWDPELSIYVKDLTHIYKSSKVEVIALSNFSLKIPKGEFLSIMGPSGSGKSTLIECLVGLLEPSAGSIYLNLDSKEIVDMSNLNSDQRADFRLNHFGYIPQKFGLFMELSVMEATILQYLLKKEQNKSKISKIEMEKIEEKATEYLKYVNLYHRRHHHLEDLSGGELQRVAIASALFKEPSIIFADEPTGELDQNNSKNIFSLFRKIAEEKGISVVSVTHNSLIKEFSHRDIEIVDGHLWNDDTQKAVAN